MAPRGSSERSEPEKPSEPTVEPADVEPVLEEIRAGVRLREAGDPVGARVRLSSL